MNQRLRYRELTDQVNSHVMDSDNLDLPGPFKDYINLYVDATTGNVCDYYSSVASEIAGFILRKGKSLITINRL